MEKKIQFNQFPMAYHKHSYQGKIPHMSYQVSAMLL